MFKEIKKWFVKGVNYETEFIAAVKRSKKWKLEVPNITLKKTPFLSGERADIALKVIQHYASMHSPEEVSQQCFGYMYCIQNALEDALQTPLYYTLGYVEFEKRPIFYTELARLERNLGDPVSGIGPIDLHAWLTTPNLEIIDLTFATTYGVVKNIPSVIGRSSFQHYSEFNDNMVYHPQLIGDDYLKKIGAIADYSSLNIIVT